MKLTADRRELAEALKWVALALSTRPPVPALAGICLNAAADGTIILTAHDYDTAHSAVVGADVSLPPLAAIAPGFMVRDLVNALKSPTVELNLEGGTLGIKAGRSSYGVATFPLADWPTPADADASIVGTVDADVLARGLTQVAGVADDDNPVSRLQGLRIEATGDALHMVGLRTSALAIARGPWSGRDFDAQLPLKSMAEAMRGLSGEVEVGVTDSLLRLRTDARTVVLRLYGHETVDWRKVIPEQGEASVEVEAELLLDAVRRAALTCKDGESLELITEREALTIKTPTGTDVVDAVNVTEHDAELTFGTEPLLAALTAVPAGPLVLNFGRALQITGKGDDFHHVVMPRRSQS